MNWLFDTRTDPFGRRLLWLTLMVTVFLSLDVHLDYSHLDKDLTVSLLGYLLPLAQATDTWIWVLRIILLGSSLLWAFERLTPWCGWSTTLSFTLLISIYWENLPWFRHKFVLPNLLLFVLALWYQLYRPNDSNDRPQPNWVPYLSLWSVCTFYGLSGLSKVLAGWPIADGTSLQLWFHLLAEEGHPLRETLIRSPGLAALLQTGSLCVELSCFLALAFRWWRLPLALLLTTFHLTVQWTFGIPFLTNIPLLLVTLWATRVGFRPKAIPEKSKIP